MIEIGNRWTILRDSMNWILVHHPNGPNWRTHKNTGAKTLAGHRTYHGRLGPVFQKILEDSLTNAPNLTAMANQLEGARREVREAAQAIHAAIGSTPPEIDALRAAEPSENGAQNG